MLTGILDTLFAYALARWGGNWWWGLAAIPCGFISALIATMISKSAGLMPDEADIASQAFGKLPVHVLLIFALFGIFTFLWRRARSGVENRSVR